MTMDTSRKNRAMDWTCQTKTGMASLQRAAGKCWKMLAGKWWISGGFLVYVIQWSSAKSRVTMASSKNFPWVTDASSTFSLRWGTWITKLQYQWSFRYPWFSNHCLPMMVFPGFIIPLTSRTQSSGRSKESRKPWSIWQAFRLQSPRENEILYIHVPSMSTSICTSLLCLCVCRHSVCYV